MKPKNKFSRTILISKEVERLHDCMADILWIVHNSALDIVTSLNKIPELKDYSKREIKMALKEWDQRRILEVDFGMNYFCVTEMGEKFIQTQLRQRVGFLLRVEIQHQKEMGFTLADKNILQANSS